MPNKINKFKENNDKCEDNKDFNNIKDEEEYIKEVEIFHKKRGPKKKKIKIKKNLSFKLNNYNIDKNNNLIFNNIFNFKKI